MSLTIGLAGMDPATETALKSAFAEANERLSSHWRLLPEAEATLVVVDMDSMYGPMSWLRLHASGKRVVGLTSAARTQTDYRLGRPFSADSLGELLREIAQESGIALAQKDQAVAAAPAAAEDVAPAPSTPAQQEEAPAAGTDTSVTPPEAVAATPPPKTAPDTEAEPATAAAPAPPSAPEPTPEPVVAPVPVAAAPSTHRLFDWLVEPGRLQGRHRYRLPSGPTLLIDTVERTYHGPAALKPLAQYFEGDVAADAFEALDDATWARETAATSPAQPLARLVWFGGLLSGAGQLLPGADPAGRYRLTRWPQTEREFPRHFRIATAMMKGPATLAEVAAASDIPLAEVVDFLNASLATGYAEAVPEPPPEPTEPAKPTGLLGRLRRR
ncbi:MAG: hypothetical protein LCH70_13525 [Proteobacteria bacterium]|nr:hypothetical protein [Pseudomonadota bacterium]